MASILLCKSQPRVVLPIIITRTHFLLFYLLSVLLTIGMSICVYIWYCKKLCCYCVLFIIIPIVNVNIVQNCRCTLVDLGQVGQFSNGETLAHSEFGKALESNSISFLSPTPLPGTTAPELPMLLLGMKLFISRKNAMTLSRKIPTWYIYIYIYSTIILAKPVGRFLSNLA